MRRQKTKNERDKTNSKKRVRSFRIELDHPFGYSLLNPGKVTVPAEIEVPIFLIRNELMSRMLFRGFYVLGLYDCYFQSHLDRLILASLGMWDGTDETYKVYFDIMEKWSMNINPDSDEITRRSLKIYFALVKERDRYK